MKSFRPIIAILSLALSWWGVACAKPVLFHPAPDVTAPEMQAATVASNGTAVTVTFSEEVVADDSAGFTVIVGGVERALTLSSGSGTTSLVFTAAEIYADEIVSAAYSSSLGDATDLAGNLLENSGISATNNSIQAPTPDDTTPPGYVSSTISSNGLNVAYVFDEAVVVANANGFTFTPSGGAATITYASGSGTTTINFTSSRAIELDETATTQYSSTTGDVADLYANDLATFGSTAVTNDSTYDSSDPYTPAAPETFTTAYSLPAGGTTYTPADSAALTTALAAADGGDVIVLTAGVTYTGNFKLRDWGAGTDWVYIISSDMADLPAEGERVGLADDVDMPTITSTSNAPLHSDFGAHHYRIAGVRVVTGTRDALATVQLSYNGNYITNADTDAELVHHITFDRCLIGSTSDAHKLRHGIMASGNYVAVLDSYIYNIKDGADAQAIWIWNGGAHYKFVNNFLEATGENFLTGGTDPKIANAVPSHIEFRRNHLFKRLAWRDVANSWTIKNLFELKNSQYHLVTGNVMENSWLDGQDGTAILFTVRNQEGTAAWSRVRDVDLRNNKILNVGNIASCVAEDDRVGYPSETTERILMDNNLGFVTADALTSSPRFLAFGSIDDARPAKWFTLTRNTFLVLDGGEESVPFQHLHFNSAFVCVDNFLCQNNIMIHGSYNPNWPRTTNSTHDHNVIVINPLDSRGSFNSDEFATFHPGDSKAANIAAVMFEDFAGGDYRLDAASPYIDDGTGGSVPGCDIDELEAATAGAISGVWP